MVKSEALDTLTLTDGDDMGFPSHRVHREESLWRPLLSSSLARQVHAEYPYLGLGDLGTENDSIRRYHIHLPSEVVAVGRNREKVNFEGCVGYLVDGAVWRHKLDEVFLFQLEGPEDDVEGDGPGGRVTFSST